MSDPARVMTWHRFFWIVLGSFLGVAAMTALVALAIGQGDDVDTSQGWLILGAAILVQLVALAVLNRYWFFRAPEHIPGAVLTGIFLRLAIGETAFLIAFVMFFAEMAHSGMLVTGLVASIVLVWLFAAPTGRKIGMLQDQLERLGGQGDVASELAAPRPPMERPQR